MKKILFSLGLLSLGLAANSQVIWQEDFEGTSGIAIPATFTQTTLATDGGFKSGTGGTLASSAYAPGDHTRFLATNDDACNCNKSADVLMTPSFSTVGYTANVYLQFDVHFYGATYQSATETAEVQYSTNGGTTWTTLGTIAGAAGWHSVAYPLTQAMNQSNVKLAFKYNDGAGWLYGLSLDNIKVLVPPSKDINTVNAYPNSKYMHSNNAFSCRIQSFGLSAVNSVTMNYQLGSGTPVSQNFTLTPALNFTDDTVLNFNAGTLTSGQYSGLKVWVSDINGTGADANNSNDTASYSSALYVSTQGTTRNVLLEEFTSSTCPPCASLNTTFDPFIQSNNPNTGGQFNVVKYQMNWPSPGNDPSYNPDGLMRRNFYGVSGIPDVYMEGRSVNPPGQTELDAAKGFQAFANMTATLTRTGTTYNGSVNFTPYVTVGSGGTLALYQTYLQKGYNYPGASTSQKDYHHAQRKMMPNGNGTTITSLTSGTAVTQSSNYTFNTVGTPTQGSYDLWNTNNGYVEYVAFLQDTVTGQVLQSASANISVGIVDLADNQSIGLYPIPANDYTIIAAKLNTSTTVDLYITDMSGRVVYQKLGEKLQAGQQEIRINTSAFAEGNYAVLVKTPLGNLNEKLTVKH